jgi:DNA helicase II / ATP-dependent DNA helicase PcrA
MRINFILGILSMQSNMQQEIEITEEDINWVEQLIFNGKGSFDTKYRRPFLRRLDSIDVVAGPGSGKTTALVAKLLILEKKMQLGQAGGVCVLTHTNVAIDLIKSKIGQRRSQLFEDPNCFCTIQSFVDRFLAIPAFVERFGFRPIRIDDDYFLQRLQKGWSFLSPLQLNGIVRQAKQRGFKSPLEFVMKGVLPKYDGDDLIYVTALKGTTLARDPSTALYQAYDRTVGWLFRKGFLRFVDAYSLGRSYLESHPRIAKLFQVRFGLVFVDEAQDLSEDQLVIIEALFPRNDVRLQMIGDPNQSIFKANDKVRTWTPKVPYLTINESKRFGKKISTRLSSFAQFQKYSVIGSDSLPSLVPHLILYDDSSILGVLPKYVSLLGDYRLDFKNPDGSDPDFTAVGWVGKSDAKEDDNKKLTISSFWNGYDKSRDNDLKTKPSIWDFFEGKCIHEAKVLKEITLRIICDFLNARRISRELSDEERLIKAGRVYYHSTSSLESTIRKYSPELWVKLTFIIADFALKSGDMFSCNYYEILNSFVNDHICGMFKILKETPVDLRHVESADTRRIPQSIGSNTYVDQEYPDFKVRVCTIHSVKGETHRATLMLETYYYGTESEKILDAFSGEFMMKKDTKVKVLEKLRMSYVALSRATHLVCVAMHVDNVQGKLENININTSPEKGWQIIDLTDG